jgi:hypothetical protein
MEEGVDVGGVDGGGETARAGGEEGGEEAGPRTVSSGLVVNTSCCKYVGWGGW